MTIVSRRGLLQTALPLAIGLAATNPSPARAQEIVDSLRVLCGFPPGGSADVVSRWIADKLAGTYARTALVDNRTGAAGRLAVDALKSSAADGKSMMLAPSSMVTLYPYIYRNLTYDPVADLTPVSVACDFVHGLAVGPAVPEAVKTIADYVAWAKANPEKANCGNPGEGSLPHLLTMVLAKATGAPIQAIPYRGGAPALVDLISGQLASLLLPNGTFLPYREDRRARVLATSGPTRSPFFPAVPTFAEQGIGEIVATEWFGLFMPARAPDAIVGRAASAIAKALQQRDLIDTFAKSGLVAMPSTPVELARRLAEERAYWGPVVKATEFKPIE